MTIIVLEEISVFCGYCGVYIKKVFKKEQGIICLCVFFVTFAK